MATNFHSIFIPAVKWHLDLWENNLECDCYDTSKCIGCVCTECKWARTGSNASASGSAYSYSGD